MTTTSPLKERVNRLLAELHREREAVIKRTIPPTTRTAALESTLSTSNLLHEQRRQRMASPLDNSRESFDEPKTVKVFRDVCRHCQRPFWSLSAAERTSHTYHCAYRSVRCFVCGEKSQAKMFGEHACNQQRPIKSQVGTYQSGVV